MPIYNLRVTAQVKYQTNVEAASKEEAKDMITNLLCDHISDSVDVILINWFDFLSERPINDEEEG